MTTNERTRMTRTDAHSPKNFDPAEYVEVGYFDNHYEDGYCSIDEGYADKDGIAGNYEARGRCDHCGAGPLRYGGLFYHAKSDTIVAVGLVCAGKLAMTSRTAYDMAKIAKANREERERRVKREEWIAADPTNAEAAEYIAQIEAEHQAHSEAVDRYNDVHEAAWREAYETNGLDSQAAQKHARSVAGSFPRPKHSRSSFVFDIVHKFNRYGTLSEKQVAAILRIRQSEIEFDAKREAEAAKLADAAPLAEGRYEIVGEIVSIKTGENDFGFWTKMLVKMEDGNKVYGTVPSALGTPERGDRVSFTARVEPSKDDEHFGFFSRPTKATHINH